MNRCKALLNAIAGSDVDAVLLHRPENMRYMTGYTGEGCVFICESEYVILTDFRYVEQATRQAPECRCIRTSRDLYEEDAVAELCRQHNVRVLMIETDVLTYDNAAALKKAVGEVSFKSLGNIIEEMRNFKDAGEIADMCKACEITCKAFVNLLDKLHTGLTEKQCKAMLDYEMLMLGSDGIAFDTIAAAGVNGSLPHAIPGDHVIAEGELLTFDFGAKINGYCADVTRTVAFGKLSPELKAIYDSVLTAQKMALDAIRPGVVAGDVDRIAREYLDARYPGAFGHSLGHGVGLFIHENIRLGPDSKTVLLPGHVVTVEPGVYIPGLGGCRIEDTIIMTEDGFIDPVTAPKELITL
ncbi:MAG: Xaa-Pro peptidase family protein [Clostridia bacterium]|nr:Xaa-Pro peptidase family protein [Clostridia bacterium]